MSIRETRGGGDKSQVRPGGCHRAGASCPRVPEMRQSMSGVPAGTSGCVERSTGHDRQRHGRHGEHAAGLALSAGRATARRAGRLRMGGRGRTTDRRIPRRAGGMASPRGRGRATTRPCRLLGARSQQTAGVAAGPCPGAGTDARTGGSNGGRCRRRPFGGRNRQSLQGTVPGGTCRASALTASITTTVATTVTLDMAAASVV